jgi:hypothetical protein
MPHDVHPFLQQQYNFFLPCTCHLFPRYHYHTQKPIVFQKCALSALWILPNVKISMMGVLKTTFRHWNIDWRENSDYNWQLFSA